MMFGLRESFEYLLCQTCGCLQLVDPDQDLSRFYPPDYYSFSTGSLRFKDPFILEKFKYFRRKYLLEKPGFIGKMIAEMTPIPRFYEYFKTGGIDRNSFVLDVGCGQGKLLNWMKREGFVNILGIDQYISADITYSNGLTILKKELPALSGSFDFIMLHHSFEHMSNPKEVLSEISRLLKPGRMVLIRIPVASSYAWEKYGINWFALDAPRHAFLHTPQSISLLAGQTGFKVARVDYDSFEIQFWGSEQYLKDIPLMDPSSHYKKPYHLFDKKTIAEYRKKAIGLNQKGKGDSACFYLQKN